MAKPANPQTKNVGDFVKLTNVSNSLVEFSYDSGTYAIEPDKSKPVKRHVAEIAVAGKIKVVDGKRVPMLEISELPEEMRQSPSGEYPQLAEEVKLLKSKIEDLEAENAELKGKVKELEENPRRAGRK